MTSSNGNIFLVTGHLCGEFTGEFPTQRPVTRSFDVFFDLRLNKQLSKQSWGWWFETPSCSFWRHCNGPGWHYMAALIIDKTFARFIPCKRVAVCRGGLETGPILSVYDTFIRYPLLAHAITWCSTGDKICRHLGQRLNTQIATTFLILWISWTGSDKMLII